MSFNRIHAVCGMLRKKRCQLCPAWEKLEGERGKVMKGCYIQAAEVVKIAQFGNPWGKRGKPKHIKSWRKRCNSYWDAPAPLKTGDPK